MPTHRDRTVASAARGMDFEQRRLDAEHARIVAELQQLPDITAPERRERIRVLVVRYEEQVDAFSRRLTSGA